MGQSSSTGRGTSAAGRGPTAPANGSAAARQQQQQRQAAAGRGYPGASTVAQFNVNSGNSQAIPNIGQMQNIFLEGTRPDLSRLNNPQRQAAPQAQLQRTFTIRNDVNLKKNSLRLVADEEHPERYHLEFVFDAATECGVTVHYAATEISGELRPRFVPLKEGTSHPKEYRPKGMGQTFRTRLHSRVMLPPLPSQYPCGSAPTPAPAPPQGPPGGSGRLDTPSAGKAGPLGAQPLPRGLERAASNKRRPFRPLLIIQARERAGHVDILRRGFQVRP